MDPTLAQVIVYCVAIIGGVVAYIAFLWYLRRK